MTTQEINERKEEIYNILEQLDEEIEILQRNIIEYREILEKVHTFDDAKKYDNFDIQKDLNIIELVFKRSNQ